MAVDLSTLGGAGAQFFDNNGVPLAGGKLYSYAASTTTPKATFTSSAGNVPHTNPIILDSSGRVPSGGEIWLTSGEAYKFVLETSTGILLGTWDNIYGYTTGTADASSEVQTATAGQTLFVLNSMAYAPGTNTLAVYIDGVNQVVNNSYIETNNTSVTFVSGLHEGAVVKFSKINIGATDASVVSYEPGTLGSVATTVAEKLQQTVSVKDFGAIGDGVADDTAAIQAALDSGAGSVYFPSGEYLVSSVSARSNTLIYGDGQASQLTASGTGNILVVSGVSGGTQIENVIVQNLSFLGLNNMSAGPLGCGVIVQHAVNVTVDQCYFDSFGPGVADTPTGGAALLFYVNCIDCTASNNTVVNGTGYLNGTDIAMYSAAGYGIVTGNRTYSTNSQGIYTNAASKVGRMIITNNISKNHTRHGIEPVYAGTTEKVDAIVANNICEDCASTGIYINTNADGVIIANNIIESCSGGGPNGYALDGGISMLGDGVKICVGNYINNSGKTTAGVTRTIDPPTVNDPTKVVAIRASNANGGVIANNVIKGSTGNGIELTNSLDDQLVSNNQISDCVNAGIFIISINNGGLSVVDANIIDASIADGYGIWHRGSTVADQSIITNNSIRGAKLGTGKAGIQFEGNGIIGRVAQNRIDNFDVGLNLQSGAMANRLGDGCVFDGNEISNCTQGFVFLSNGNDFGFYTNFVYTGNGTNAVDVYGFNTVLPAVSVSPVKLFYRSAQPAAGTWAVGDRVINNTPTVGQPKSWVCTVAGTPGTWVSEGNL